MSKGRGGVARAAALAATAMALACSGGSLPGGEGVGGAAGAGGSGGAGIDNGVGGPCTYTLSGGATLKGTCTVSATQETSVDKMVFSILSEPHTGFAFQWVLDGSTAFDAGTFTPTGTAANSDSSYNPQGVGPGHEWNMKYNELAAGPNQGTFTLTIESTGAAIVHGTYMTWGAPHGTASITLTNLSTAPTHAPVQAQVTF